MCVQRWIYANVEVESTFIIKEICYKKKISVFMQYLQKVKPLSSASKADGLNRYSLHELYPLKAAPTLQHLKLRGRDRWEVGKQITGARKKKKKKHTRTDGNLIKM